MKCPNCNHKLDIMNVLELKPHHARIKPKADETVYDLQFNCDNCTHDWRSVVGIPYDEKLYPKFWG